MKRIYPPNYKGYLFLHRAILYLFTRFSLSAAEFAYLIVFLTQTAYDRRHKDLYTIITKDDKQIAAIMGVDQSTVHKQKTKLMKKGLIEKHNSYYKLNIIALLTKENVVNIPKLDEEQRKNIFAKTLLSAEEITALIAKMLMDIKEETFETVKENSKSTFSSREDLTSSEDYNEDVDPDDIPF